MDKIIVKGLKLFAYHGVNPEEKIDGQNFILDITTEVDMTRAQTTDDVENTVSYAKIIKTARAVFTAESYDLIETAANKVCTELMKTYPSLESITLLLKKPEAPIKAEFEYVAVEKTITREQMAGITE